MTVPTAQALVAEGLADVVERNRKGEAVAYRIGREGYERIFYAMKYNATLLVEDDVLRRGRETEAIRDAKRGGLK